MCYSFVYVGVFWGGCLANFQYIIMAAFNALGTRGAIFLLHQFRGLQVSFGLQGSREPGLYDVDTNDIISLFQSTRLSRASTVSITGVPPFLSISIHKALASLDTVTYFAEHTVINFNPQGSREPRLCLPGGGTSGTYISIHKALASLDKNGRCWNLDAGYFNPQGSREPRPSVHISNLCFIEFQSTRLSRASTHSC